MKEVSTARLMERVSKTVETASSVGHDPLSRLGVENQRLQTMLNAFTSESATAGPAAQPNSPASLRLDINPKSSTPTPQNATQERRSPSALEVLLKLESDARSASDKRELAFLIANEGPALLKGRLAFVVEISSNHKCKVVAVSGVSTVDTNAAGVVAVQTLIKRASASGQAALLQSLQVREHLSEAEIGEPVLATAFLLWLPMKDRKDRLFGGILVLRENPWGKNEDLIATRVSKTFAHAWCAFGATSIINRSHLGKPRYWLFAGLGALALLIVPVPLTVLAPFEVASQNLKVVTSPIDGVIADILIEPNQAVSEGDVVAALVDTNQSNETKIAAEELAVSETDLRRIMQTSITDPRSLKDISVAKAEVEVRRAKLEFAQQRLAQSTMKSVASGVAVFGDKQSLVGKPVRTGERILGIADPKVTELHVYVGLKDNIQIETGSSLTAFLDADPTRPLTATVTRVSYEAAERPNRELAYKIVATFSEDDPVEVRLGSHGTAKLYGKIVPLGFWLFRRPLTAARQWLGL